MANDGLAIGSATYGRSISGAKLLKNDFDGSIDYLIKVLNGDKYAAFKKTINANWVGADATDFLNDIEKNQPLFQMMPVNMSAVQRDFVDLSMTERGGLL